MNFIHHFSVRRKIFIVAMVGIASMVIIGGLALLVIIAQQSAMADVGRRMSATATVSGLAKEITNIHSNIYKGLGWQNIGYDQDQIDKLYADQTIVLDTIKNRVLPLESQGMLHPQDSTAALLTVYAGWIAKVIDMASVDLSVASTFMTPADKAAEKLLEQLGMRIAELEKESADRAASIQKTFNLIMIIGSVFMLVAVGVALFMSMWISRLITRPVERTADVMRKVADGDLREDVQTLILPDEIGRIVETVNTTIDVLRSIVSTIQQKADSVAQSSTRMVDSSEQIRVSAHSTTERTAAAATSAESVSAAMMDINLSVGMLSSTIASLSTAVEEFGSAFSGIARRCNDENDKATEAHRRMGRMAVVIEGLQAAAEEIGSVTVTIRNIADDTSLLSLNAAIEAATAGEAGKGFAVVASAIKELAKLTLSATGDVETKIGEIQRSVQEVTGSVGAITGLMADISSISGEILGQVEKEEIILRTVVTEISEAGVAARDTAATVNRSAEEISSIASIVAEVNSQLTGTVEHVDVLHEESAALAAISLDLDAEVGRFIIR